jgi:alpha-tubulin suppressor-like RCC1 family protein
MNDWSNIFSGGAHTVAIKKDGTLWIWGSNGDGQLGLGDTIDKYSPIKLNDTNDWSNISCGNYHTVVIR